MAARNEMSPLDSSSLIFWVSSSTGYTLKPISPPDVQTKLIPCSSLRLSQTNVFGSLCSHLGISRGGVPDTLELPNHWFILGRDEKSLQ